MDASHLVPAVWSWVDLDDDDWPMGEPLMAPSLTNVEAVVDGCLYWLTLEEFGCPWLIWLVERD